MIRIKMASSLCILLSVCAVLSEVTSVWGQSIEGNPRTASSAIDSSFFQGKWSYRSFRSNPDLAVPANDLLFGSGTMEISISDAGQLTGTLGGTGWQLTLTGTATNGNPSKVQFQGRGIIGNEEWVCDYIGFQVPAWPIGVDQRPAIVGSIVRTVPHSGGVPTAGYIAQWMAVKQDAVSPADNENELRSDATGAEAEVREFESKWAKAVATSDAAQIGKFFSESFLFVGAGGILQDRQQHLDDFQSGRLKVDSVEISEFTTHIYERFAVVNTLATVKGKLGERNISGVYRFMDTLRLEGDQWLAVARQQTRSIVNNASAQIEFNVESENYKFAINAVTNPSLKVPQGSQVKVSLTSRQGSHDWVLANEQGTVLAKTSRVSAGQPPVVVEFTASEVGEFTYYCSVGIHRARGMEGRFVIESDSLDGESAKIRPNFLERGRNLPSDQILRQRYLQENPLDEESRNSLKLSDPAMYNQLFAATSEVRSTGGRLDVTLDVAYETATIGNDAVHLRMYNQKLVGPTLRVKAGDVMHITLNNRLPLEAPMGHEVNGHHGWNTTNLHFHGLHVAPQGPVGIPDAESDNVLVAIPPSEPFDPAKSTQGYQVHIPANHVAGTFWYHAHKHGSTTAQVSSGMAGALIIERDDAVHNLDSVPEISAAKEEIMVLQEIPYLKDSLTLPGEIERSPASSPDPNLNDVRMFSPGSFRNLRRYVTVNGEKIPTITMAPNEVRRLRLIYSGQRESVRLRVERAPGSTAGPANLTLHEIAVDGLPTGSVRAIDPSQSESRNRVLELFPGYRSDVLLQAPGVAGDYYLVDTRNDTTRPDGTIIPRTETGADGSLELLRWVAKIRVEGASVPMTLPTPASLVPHRFDDLSAAAVTNTRYAFYGLELGLTPIGFFISRDNLSASNTPVSLSNAEPYNPANPRRLPLGATERWLVGSRNNGAAVIHPFHIHVNPFLIASVNSLVEPGSAGVPIDVTAREIGSPTWRDTLAMKHGYTYELLTRYDDFTGDFVDHCHILDHEDNGMMELVRIDPATTPAPVPLTSLPKPSTNTIGKTIPTTTDTPSVILFVQGSLCPHCMAQMSEMAKRLTENKVDVSVVSASTEEDLMNFPIVPFRLIADPEYKLFKKHGAYRGKAMHATLVRDRSGKELLREIGEEPFMDVAAVMAALKETSASYVIAVRESDEAEDDYLTWSATACTIRMVNGDLGSGPVTVTLTNDDPSANPDAGELRFAKTLLPKSTATLPTLTLEVNPDGSPVAFFVAGNKASTLTPASLINGGRDTKIIIHAGNESGPQVGEHSVMVRVRKALRHPSDPRPRLTNFELSEFLKALRDLHFIDNRLEWYVRMHRLATSRGTFAHPAFGDPPTPKWPDQAHVGSGFIAWHRAFLLQFERELQVRYPYVALPYWVQGTSQTFFAEDRLGEPASIGDVVRFQPGSPLYGWSISLPMDRGGATDPMGLLRRRPLNHNDPSAPAAVFTTGPLSFYRQWADFAALPTIASFTTIRNVETNPHNNGHGTVGPNGIWMSNCRESNADPVFYLFHCNHDYLWAKWQYELDRFLNDGSDPLHYFPNDEFVKPTANKNIPLGHHLNDTMWPWDGTTNQVVTGFDTSNRPNINGFGAFPTSQVPLLWPSVPAQPRPADMIDYLGLLSNSNDLGFCYDDVPFGARRLALFAGQGDIDAQAQESNRVSLAVVSNRKISSDTRLLALESLSKRHGAMTPESVKLLSDITNNKAESPELRSQALRQWFAESPTDAFGASLILLADNETALSIRLTALSEAGRQMHFSDVPHSEGHRVLDQLRNVLREESPPQLKAEAIRILAPSGDPLAKEELLASLAPKNASALQLHETIALLRFFPDQKGLLREFITSPNDQAAVAAIHALFNDADSVDLRRQLARDNQESAERRKAAIQSLIHDDDGELTNFLIEIAADASVELDLRIEALAATSVRLRKSVMNMTDADKRTWTNRLKAIEASETTVFGKLRRDALSIVSTVR